MSKPVSSCSPVFRDQWMQTFFTDPRVMFFTDFALSGSSHLHEAATPFGGSGGATKLARETSVAVQTFQPSRFDGKERKIKIWDRIKKIHPHDIRHHGGNPSVGIQVGSPTSYLVNDIIESPTIRPLLPREFRLDCYRKPAIVAQEFAMSGSSGGSEQEEDECAVDMIDEVSETLATRFDSVARRDYHTRWPYEYDRSERCERLRRGFLTDGERLCIEQFYKCMGCHIHLAKSAALLFINDRDATRILSEWKRLYVGVPLWLFNSGLFKSKPRKLQLVIAEIGSGFILVDATVDWRSDVRHPRPGYITLTTKDEKTVLALRFFSREASAEFYRHFEILRDDPRNADIFASSGGTVTYQRYNIQRISKKAISYPTGFRHLNSLKGSNNESLYSIRALL